MYIQKKSSIFAGENSDFMEDVTYYCRKCGAKLPLNADAILKHYEKNHFSDWAANKDLIARMPKAFVVTSTQNVQTVKNVQKNIAAEAEANKPIESPDTKETIAKREANKDAIMERLKKCADKQQYKLKEPYTCECCGRQLNIGMIILCARERFTLCYDCYNVTRFAIPHKTREMK